MHEPSATSATPPEHPRPQIVVYFGGDVQSYSDIMARHRDNRRHVQWSLENTATHLHTCFPGAYIVVAKPCVMIRDTFSCWRNFVSSDNITGVPKFSPNYHALEHLEALCATAAARVPGLSPVASTAAPRVTLVGFSKGSVVLNQIVHELAGLASSIHTTAAATATATATGTATTATNEAVARPGLKISHIVWLDSGHNGPSNHWITNTNVARALAESGIRITIHVTPYQVCNPRKPWNGKEEATFRRLLVKYGAGGRVCRQIHFAGELSLESHFNVLKALDPQLGGASLSSPQ